MTVSRRYSLVRAVKAVEGSTPESGHARCKSLSTQAVDSTPSNISNHLNSKGRPIGRLFHFTEGERGMRLDELGVSLRQHAYDQYCARVGAADWKDVYNGIVNGLQHRYQRYNEYVAINGIWWVTEVTSDTIHFITCFGKVNYDLPATMRWQAKHKDRVVMFDDQRST